jgi:hypothetical protein
MKSATSYLPSGSRAVMASRREPPDSLEFFPTPPWATRALFFHVLPLLTDAVATVWEPACGEGHLAVVAEEFTSLPVVASDIFDYGFGTTPIDFLHDVPVTQPDWVVTNPPFSVACEFTLRALELASEGVGMLVRTQWIEGQARYQKLFRDSPPTIYAPFVERVPMVKGRWDPDASTATSYAWFVWFKGLPGPTRVYWIPPGCRARFSKADDRARFAAWSFRHALPLLDGTASGS